MYVGVFHIINISLYIDPRNFQTLDFLWSLYQALTTLAKVNEKFQINVY